MSPDFCPACSLSGCDTGVTELPAYTRAKAASAAFNPDNWCCTRSRSFFNCFTIPDKLANVVSPLGWGTLTDNKGTKVLGTTHGIAQSYWSNSKCGSVVVRFATFRAGDIGVMFSRFFGVMFCHFFGVMLSHLFKEGRENMAATPA